MGTSITSKVLCSQKQNQLGRCMIEKTGVAILLIQKDQVGIASQEFPFKANAFVLADTMSNDELRCAIRYPKLNVQQSLSGSLTCAICEFSHLHMLDSEK